VNDRRWHYLAKAGVFRWVVGTNYIRVTTVERVLRPTPPPLPASHSEVEVEMGRAGVAIECCGSVNAVRVTERVRDRVPSGRNGMVGSDTVGRYTQDGIISKGVFQCVVGANCIHVHTLERVLRPSPHPSQHPNITSLNIQVCTVEFHSSAGCPCPHIVKHGPATVWRLP
jgi:hypothetical protein